MILVTIFITSKQIRESFIFSNPYESQWELNENQNHDATNWLQIWFELATFEAKPTTHELWETELEYFLANYEISEQGRYILKWLRITFPEAPYMIYIANCESTGLVHRKNGKLLPNATGGSDRGVLQIHMDTHRAQIKKLGLNMEKNKHYFQFARILYDENGINPWNSSRHCWGDHHQRIISYL